MRQIKRTIIMFIMLFITLCINAQCRIGYTFDEISAEFKKTNKLEITELGKKHTLIVYLSQSKVYHVFNDIGKCFCTVVKPGTIEKLDSMICDYNTIYTQSGDYKWIGDVGDGKVLFELAYFPEIGMCIVMSRYIEKKEK